MMVCMKKMLFDPEILIVLVPLILQRKKTLVLWLAFPFPHPGNPYSTMFGFSVDYYFNIFFKNKQTSQTTNTSQEKILV